MTDLKQIIFTATPFVVIFGIVGLNFLKSKNNIIAYRILSICIFLFSILMFFVSNNKILMFFVCMICFYLLYSMNKAFMGAGKTETSRMEQDSH
jgi:uncharacterized membrane protein